MVWLAAIGVLVIAQWVVLRGRPAVFRYRWQPLVSALPLLAAIGLFADAGSPSEALFLSLWFGAFWVLMCAGEQFCERCGADVRNRLQFYRNWASCPKCMAPVRQTPPEASFLFYIQFGSIAGFMVLGAFAMMEGWVAVLAAAAVPLAAFAWASLAVRRLVRVPARSAAERAAAESADPER